MEEKFIREKIIRAKKLCKFFIISWFLLCGAIAYLFINIISKRPEGEYRNLLIISVFVCWFPTWLLLVSLSSKISKRKLGLKCSDCGKVCFAHKGLEDDINEETFVKSGKCNYCGKIIFEIS
jgi:surface polysaccharide O-acyltransferase-like enzyme